MVPWSDTFSTPERLSSEISPTRTYLTSYSSVGRALDQQTKGYDHTGSIPQPVKQTFQLSWCGRLTQRQHHKHISSPECITPETKKRLMYAGSRYKYRIFHRIKTVVDLQAGAQGCAPLLALVRVGGCKKLNLYLKVCYQSQTKLSFGIQCSYFSLDNKFNNGSVCYILFFNTNFSAIYLQATKTCSLNTLFRFHAMFYSVDGDLVQKK